MRPYCCFLCSMTKELKCNIIWIKLTCLCLLLNACVQLQVSKDTGQVTNDTLVMEKDPMIHPPTQRETRLAIIIPKDIQVKNYFAFVDSIITAYDTLLDYPLTEHLLIRANPRIIDTLAGFDYYQRISQGRFIYDQREMTVLKQGDTLWLPDQQSATSIAERLKHTVLDVNIPEYKLRIMEYDTVKYTFLVRVGRNERKYLKTAGRVANLHTPIGTGEIVRIKRNPWFVNPVTGIPYSLTKRDDGRYTRMPQIPWLEPMINGLRQGALIHPTSNANTLGKAYSNGCIGTGEGDAWIIYYHAPVGTQVRFRYDVEVPDAQGDTLRLKDIYQLQQPKKAIPSISHASTGHCAFSVSSYGHFHQYLCH